MAAGTSLDLSGVEWKEIRSAFIRARGKRRQHAIAAAAGLAQGDISKIENNDLLGPTVGTFIKAVEGLGLKPSEFFASLESGRAELDADTKPSAAHVRMTGSDTPPRDKHTSTSTVGGAHGGDRSVQARERMVEAFIQFGKAGFAAAALLADAESGRHPGQSDRKTGRPREKKTGRR